MWVDTFIGNPAPSGWTSYYGPITDPKTLGARGETSFPYYFPHLRAPEGAPRGLSTGVVTGTRFGSSVGTVHDPHRHLVYSGVRDRCPDATDLSLSVCKRPHVPTTRVLKRTEET